MAESTWGRWHRDGSVLVYHAPEGEPDPQYEISLDAFRCESDVIRWGETIAEKRWASSEDIRDVLAAGRSLLAERRHNDNRDLRSENAVGVPPPMSWETYHHHVLDQWSGFLDKSDPTDEKTFHTFLEQHPCLLPDPYSTFGGGHNGTIHSGFVSQPELPGFRRKHPDFMLVAHDSATVLPILIEIEAPAKKWANSNGTPNAHLTQAIDQLRSWKAWFREPENVLQFRKTYGIDDSFLRIRQLEPRYVLIYGRRSEATAIEAFAKKRDDLQNDDEVFMTYDRLAPSRRNHDLLMLRHDRVGADARLRVVTVPPTFSIDRYNAEAFSLLTDREDAIRQSPLLSQERKDLLILRTAYADDYVRRLKRLDTSGDAVPAGALVANGVLPNPTAAAGYPWNSMIREFHSLRNRASARILRSRQ